MPTEIKAWKDKSGFLHLSEKLAEEADISIGTWDIIDKLYPMREYDDFNLSLKYQLRSSDDCNRLKLLANELSKLYNT